MNSYLAVASCAEKYDGTVASVIDVAMKRPIDDGHEARGYRPPMRRSPWED